MSAYKNDTKKSFRLAFLGTGTCSSTKRNPSSFAISDGNIITAVDFGGGAYHQLSRLDNELFDPGKLKNIFITHFHNDHISGLPDLIWGKMYSPIDSGNKELIVYGPPGLQKFWNERLMPFIGKEPSFKVTLRELSNEYFAISDDISVKCSPVFHSENSVAYSFEINGKIISITGDTGLNDNLISIINMSDIAITEWSFTDNNNETAKHMNNNSILKLLDSVRSDCDLYFTHIYPENGMDFMEQIKKIKKFIANNSNKCFFPEDLLVIDIK